jgi:hypothetical protein
VPSSGIWRCVGLQKTDILEERVASVFRIERISEREAALEVECLVNSSRGLF